MRPMLAALALVALTACAPPAQVSKSQPLAGVGFGDLSLRAASGAVPATRSLARDFMDLSFALESGQTIETFTRFEGPITVTFAGAVPASAPRDLADLLSRLRSEAGIDISQTSISGISSGGFMTVQFQLAHSSIVKGVGVVAGGPFNCSKADVLRAVSSCSTASARNGSTRSVRTAPASCWPCSAPRERVTA